VTAQDEQVAAFETGGADYAEPASRLRDPLRQILAGYAAPRRGDRVLGACCGTGAPGLPAARAVGPTGRERGLTMLDAGTRPTAASAPWAG
jgi:hypothetical protein